MAVDEPPGYADAFTNNPPGYSSFSSTSSADSNGEGVRREMLRILIQPRETFLPTFHASIILCPHSINKVEKGKSGSPDTSPCCVSTSDAG
jgi:hypothetical protein